MFFLRLNQITENVVLKISDITDEQERIRLADFGFIKGATIKIISKSKGMYLLRLNNSLYAINDFLASHFVVEEN